MPTLFLKFQQTLVTLSDLCDLGVNSESSPYADTPIRSPCAQRMKTGNSCRAFCHRPIGLTDMKRPIIAVVIIALFGAAVLGDASAQSNLIVAGQSIGQTHLGRFGADYLARLPKPDADDSGMGRYRSVWLSKNQAGRKDTLYIFSVANGPRDIEPSNGVSIELIRVTSPWYHTANGISTGITLPRILRGFPGVRSTDSSLNLYDDANRGIAFEFAGGATAGSPCIAIMVHPPGKVDLTSAKDVNEILRANGVQP
jgi:hypothetical protein